MKGKGGLSLFLLCGCLILMGAFLSQGRDPSAGVLAASPFAEEAHWGPRAQNRMVEAGPMDNYLYLPLVLQNYLPCEIGNCDFELGHAYWTEYAKSGWPVIMKRGEGLPSTVTPHSGFWLAWLGGENNEIGYLQQAVTVPAARPYLSYWHWIASRDQCGYDIAYVIVNEITVEQYDLCESNNTSGWVLHSVNLSAYAGQTVQLQLRVETDGSLNSNLFLDDFAFRSAGH